MADDFDAMARLIAESDDEQGYFEQDDEWPNCPTPDCEYKVNQWGGLGLCSPCSERAVGVPEMMHRYEATRISATDRRWNGVPYKGASVPTTERPPGEGE